MLFEEQPLLSLAGINKMKSKTHSVKRVKQHTVWAELQHSVFVYYDMSDKRALHLRHILMNNKSKEEEENEQMHEQHQQNQSAASRSEDGNGNGDELTMKTEKIRHEIRKRCLLNMLESSIDLVHDLTSTNYTAKEKRIVFDHLIPMRKDLEGLHEYYIPDGTYNALKYTNGKWEFKNDVAANNPSYKNPAREKPKMGITPD